MTDVKQNPGDNRTYASPVFMEVRQRNRPPVSLGDISSCNAKKSQAASMSNLAFHLRPLHEFDEYEFCRVSATETGLHDPGIAALAIRVFRSDGFE